MNDVGARQLVVDSWNTLTENALYEVTDDHMECRGCGKSVSVDDAKENGFRHIAGCPVAIIQKVVDYVVNGDEDE